MPGTQAPWTRGRRIELVVTVHRLCGLFEELVQVASLEQSIAIRWNPMHWDLATSGPFAKCVLCDSDVLGSRGSMEVIS